LSAITKGLVSDAGRDAETYARTYGNVKLGTHEKPRETRDSLSLSRIELDRVVVHRRNHHHLLRLGHHLMLDATPGAILEV
jgi:hypothetical protein